MTRHLASHLRTALWTCLIALLLLMPGGSLSGLAGQLPEILAPWIDKVVHAGLFFVQALLLRRSLAGLGVRKAGWLAAIAAVGYGLVLEILQIPVPERSFDLPDLAADGLGAGLALVSGGPRGSAGRSFAIL